MLYKYKRVILVSQFTLVCTVIGIIHALEDLVDGLYFHPLMDSLMALCIFISYLMNERGYHKQAKIFLLGFLNVFFFVYSSLANHQLGIYLYYFANVGLAAVVFEANENFYRYFFIACSVAFVSILFLTGFDAFGSVTFEATDVERSFIINFVTSIAVLVFFIVFMSNVNEQSEQKLMKLAEEIRIQNVNLEKANNELDRFFYSTSHDLKVPLSDMDTLLNEGLHQTEDVKSKEVLTRIKERTTRLHSFLKDILDHTRNRKSNLEMTSFLFNDLIDEVIENFRMTEGFDRIIFRREFNKSLRVVSDRIRLLMILNNLIANAIKYHNFSQAEPWIKVEAAIASQHLLISVSDNGQGIESYVLPKIFNMFYRGTNQSAGSGLGLYIVREAVEKLDGSITAESEPGYGTTFRISLPHS